MEYTSGLTEHTDFAAACLQCMHGGGGVLLAVLFIVMTCRGDNLKHIYGSIHIALTTQDDVIFRIWFYLYTQGLIPKVYPFSKPLMT